MITYKVRYRMRGQWFFKTLRGIKGDGIMADSPIGVRFFITKDERRIEIPVDGTVFMFGKERHDLIRENMRRESGVQV